MTSPLHHPHPHHHLQDITQIALVDHYDASHGLFGELIDPSIVLQGLALTDHVGRLDDPTAAQATQAIHSFLCEEDGREIRIDFENTTSHTVIIRWMDEKGHCYPSQYQWTMEPFSSMTRYSRLGHLFVFSVLIENEEQLLGAYRIRMPMPSGSAHWIWMEQDPSTDEEDFTSFQLEAMLADETGHDERIVASAALDTVGAGPNQASLTKTIQTLSTILDNIIKHPDDPKFRSLRLSNPKVQKTIGSWWGARQFLHSVGFRKDATKDDHLILEPPSNHSDSTNQPEQQLNRLNQASQLLEQLLQRAQPGFVTELAPTPPWQGPVLNSTTTSAPSFGTTGNTHFLSDDEKWKRAERNRQRRGRAGRRPEPGHAPSSNGRWGR